MKPRLLLYSDISGTINCNTFSVVPSIIDEIAKNVVFNCDTLAVVPSIINDNQNVLFHCADWLSVKGLML
jgi:hypothetical protein